MVYIIPACACVHAFHLHARSCWKLWNAWSFHDLCCNMVNVIIYHSHHDIFRGPVLSGNSAFPNDTQNDTETIHQTILPFPFCQTSPSQNFHDFAFAVTASACLVSLLGCFGLVLGPAGLVLGVTGGGSGGGAATPAAAAAAWSWCRCCCCCCWCCCWR